MVSKVEQSLKGKEELFEKLKQVITGTAVLNPYWGEEGDKKKKNHFPAVYNQYRLPFLFEAINAGYLKQIEELQVEYEVAKQEGNLPASKEIRKSLKVLNRKLARNE